MRINRNQAQGQENRDHHAAQGQADRHGKRAGTGLVHIYCGDGKGKTTCGMGLCCRAAGAGMKVVIIQFMKDNSTSERKLLAALPNVIWLDGKREEKFSFQMTEEEKTERRQFYSLQLHRAFQTAEETGAQVLFLDEAIYTVRAGLLDEDELLECLDGRPDELEVILTGQGPSEELVCRADYVTEMKKVKHPYDRGQMARKGIER